jgi:hypothetical protein
MEMYIAQLELLPPNNNESSSYATLRPPPNNHLAAFNFPIPLPKFFNVFFLFFKI